MGNQILLSDIRAKIHTVRNVKVILDHDLADLYQVETKVLNQAVKRNIERFPEKFMFIPPDLVFWSVNVPRTFPEFSWNFPEIFRDVSRYCELF